MRSSINSLRSQLLLWISLPLLVVLLTVALAGVQGHGQAMHEMVQTRGNGLARASSALIAMRIDRSRDALVRLSTLPVLHQADVDAAAVAASLDNDRGEFDGGLVLYQNGRPEVVVGTEDGFELEAMTPLVREVATIQTARVATIQGDNGWLLVHVVPVPVAHGGVERVLVGAVPLEALGLSDLL